MKARRLVGHGLRSMGRHKARTFFMMLGTLIGVSALIVVVAMGQGAQKEMRDRMNVLFSGRSIFLYSAAGGMGGPRDGGPAQPLTLEDRDAILETIPGVTMADATLLVSGREVVYQGESRDLMIFGHGEDADVVWSRGVTRGRFFTRTDLEQSARVALVGEETARDLFGTDDPVGASFRMGNVPFEVIGVLERVGVDPHGLNRDDEIHVPLTTAMRRLVNVDFVGSIKMLVSEDTDLDQTVFAIEDLLRERHGLTLDEPADFHMVTPVRIEEVVESNTRVFTLFLPLVAGLSILVGGIVVANLMLMGVNERRAEIGLRKAVGARTRDIWGQFLIETVIITGLAGLLALGVGFVVISALSARQEMAGGLSPGVALLGLLTAMGVGLLAGVLPARRAASLDAVETLR
jgi:ABC-type antimicrobial peptide transport system permease subunit